MSHMLDGENVGLVSVRQVAEEGFNHVIVVDKMIESRMTLSNKGIGFLYPLYSNDKTPIEEREGVRENLSPEFRRWIDLRYGHHYSAEQILAVVYAQMHSLDWRRRYADFLRIDFSAGAVSRNWRRV